MACSRRLKEEFVVEMITLKELCAVVGVSRRSIQCYEKAELMKASDKNKYGYLLYDTEAVNRATKIKFLQELGFKLSDIKELIDEPADIIKAALIEKVVELEGEMKRIEVLIKKTREYIEKIS